MLNSLKGQHVLSLFKRFIMSDAKHLHLVTGEVTFHHNHNENSIHKVLLNAVISGSDVITATYLVKAEQALQSNFQARTGENVCTILDVVLMNFVYLGFMPQEQFEDYQQETGDNNATTQ